MTPCRLVLCEDAGNVLVVIAPEPVGDSGHAWTTVFETRLDAAVYLQGCGALTSVEAGVLHRDGIPVGSDLVVMSTKIPDFKRTIASHFSNGFIAESLS